MPQPVALLLFDARKRETKRTAKRAANRRSASTSRARKKALVEEMTRTNARLRRQALILSLLPDLVVAITVDGTVTFCSAQVERILQHKNEDLVGARLPDLLLPDTRMALQGLIDQLVATKEGEEVRAALAREAAGGGGGGGVGGSGAAAPQIHDGDGGKRRGGIHHPKKGLGGGVGAQRGGDPAAVISEHSEQSFSHAAFPLAVVNVKNRQGAAPSVAEAEAAGAREGAGEDERRSPAGGNGSDSSGTASKGVTASSLTNSTAMSRSTTNSSLEKDAAGGGSDDAQTQESVSTDRAVKQSHEGSGSGHRSGGLKKAQQHTPPEQPPPPRRQSQQPSSGDDSSNSSNGNSFRQASDALNRNVRWHNEKMMNKKSLEAKGPTDDVTGASVTANNAGARLSSLQHVPGGASPPAETEGMLKKSDSMEEQLSNSTVEDGPSKLRASANSALRERPTEDASEDSGYRESGESVPSREDSSTVCSAASEINNGGVDRAKPLAPTCNVCVIRKDMSTIWCEVTSSICALMDDETEEGDSNTAGNSLGKVPSSSDNSSSEAAREKPPKEVHELLLCFRPIRDGEAKAPEALRFVPPAAEEKKAQEQDNSVDQNSNTITSNSGSSGPISSLTTSAAKDESGESTGDLPPTEAGKKSPSVDDSKCSPKPVSSDPSQSAESGNGSSTSDSRASDEPCTDTRKATTTESEKNVAESLVLMNKSTASQPQ